MTGRGVRATTEAGVAHIAEDRQLRGLVLDFSLTENLALREYRDEPLSKRRLPLDQRTCAGARTSCSRSTTCAAATLTCPRRRCRAATSRRSASRARSRRNPQLLIAHQPTRGLDVGAIEFVHRRLMSERDRGRGILLVSLEFEEVRSLADRILVIYEGEIVGEFPPERLRGGARHRDDRRRRRQDRRVSEEEVIARSQTPASRLAAYVRGGGVIVPLITVLLAFVIGGFVVLLAGKDPIATYEAIWKGTGLQWLFPWTTGEDRTLAALNLQQTLIITTPLILTGLAVAFAFRAGLFNIGGKGQYIMGSIAAVWVGSSFADMPALLHIVLAMVAAVAAGAFWAGIAGFLKATVGAHEVISTIMLNYIAIFIGLYLFGLGGPLQSDTRGRACRCRTTWSRAPSCRCSGATRSSRASTSASSSRSRRCSCSGWC